MNHPERVLCFNNRLWIDSMPIVLFQWYPIPQTECDRNLNARGCMYCGVSLCEACFCQSELLMGTIGDVNPLFDEQDYSPTYFVFPRLEYYPEDFGCFGLLRICIYCEAMRRQDGNQEELIFEKEKAKWRDLMQLKK